MNFPAKNIFRLIFSKFVVSKKIHGKPTEIEESTSNLPKDFNETNYLILNPDVKNQGLDPLEHYLHFGYAESRPYKFGEFLKGKQIFNKNKETCLVVVHDFALTGSPLLALAVTKKLNTHLNVVVLSLVEEGKLKDLFIENSSAVFCVSALFDDYQVSAGIVKTLIDEFEFDFSIVNSASANNILFGLSKYNIPTVTLIHEFAQTTESKKVSRCLELSNVCVFSTESTLGAGLKELGKQPNSKIFIQTQGKISHNEVLGDLSFVTTSETGFEQILDKTKVKVLGVGSLLMTKGVDLFLQIAQLVEERQPNQFQFIWVGSKSELEEKNYGVFIKEFIEKSKGLNNFIFLEQTSELPKLMKEIDAYALTSRLDTFPNVAIEALCLGKPLICFEKTGGIPNYLESLKVQGLCIANYLDVSDFATKLIKLVNDQNSLDRFSKEIKVKAESDFDMDLYAKKLLEFGTEAKKLVSLKNG